MSTTKIYAMALRGSLTNNFHPGFVVSVALCFGIYSMGKKLVVDKQMRLSRQNREE